MRFRKENLFFLTSQEKNGYSTYADLHFDENFMIFQDAAQTNFSFIQLFRDR
jgi:hypothetical protein